MTAEKSGFLDVNRDVSNNLLAEALMKYNIDFFKQFAFEGSSETLKLSQQVLEDVVRGMDKSKDITQLILAMIHQSYELNQYIPNIELVLYRMFF